MKTTRALGMPSPIHQESTTLLMMLIMAVISTVMVYVLDWKGALPTTVSGQWSLSTLLVITGAWPALVSFRFGYLNNVQLLPVTSRLAPWRRWLHLTSLSLAFALFFGTLGLLAGVFIEEAFADWVPEPVAIGLLACFSSAISSYLTVHLAKHINTIHLLQIAMLFLGIGICSSMLLNDDPHWWQRSFSYLGDLEGNTFWLFSFTLVVAGVLLLSISDFIGYDLQKLAGDHPEAQKRLKYIKMLFFGLAVSISLVGLIPNVTGEVWGLLHNIVARIMLGIYFALIAGSSWLLPGLSRIFQVLSMVVIGLVGFFYLVMYKHWQYLNVMSFELLSFFVCLGWLYLFVQTIMIQARAHDKDSW